jgi:hypothetical protein
MPRRMSQSMLTAQRATAFISSPIRESLPILRQVISRSKRPSPRLMLALSAALFIASTAAAIWLLYARFDGPQTRLYQWWMIGRYAVFQLGSQWPYLTTMATAALVDRQVRSEPFALIRQTAVSDRAVVAAYSLSSLYRLRVLFLPIMLFPLLWVKTHATQSNIGPPFWIDFKLIPVGEIVEIVLAVIWQVGLAALGASLITALRVRLGREAQPILLLGAAAAYFVAVMRIVAELLLGLLRVEPMAMTPLHAPFMRMGMPPVWVIAMGFAALACARLSWQIGWRDAPSASRKLVELACAALLFLAVPLASA